MTFDNLTSDAKKRFHLGLMLTLFSDLFTPGLTINAIKGSRFLVIENQLNFTKTNLKPQM